MNSLQDFFYELWNRPLRFFKRLKNAYQFAKFGFNDFDWDQSYFYYLLEFKLKRMQKFFHSKDSYSGCKNTRRTIDLCVNLLERINGDKDFYCVNRDKHTKKWGESDYYFVPSEHPNLSRLKDRREDSLTEKQIAQKNKEISEAIVLDDAHRRQDLDLLFDTMKKWSEYWWD